MAKHATHPAIKQVSSTAHKTVEIVTPARAKAAEKIRLDTAAFSAAMNKGKGATHAAAMAHENDGTAPAPSIPADNVTKLPVKAKGKGKSAAPSESAVTLKAGQVHNVPWRDLIVEPGYNVRTFDPENPKHRALAESIRLVGVQTPLTVRRDPNGGLVILAGHLRAGSCEWLARDGGGKRFVIPSVPVILREDLESDTRKRNADLSISNSAVTLTPMEKAEVAARMKADQYSDSAIGAHLGNIGPKWVSELVKLYELRGTPLADMVQKDHIKASTALHLVNTHGKDEAASLAVAVLTELFATAKYGDTPRVTQGRVDTYLAKLAKMAPDKAKESGQSEESSEGTGPAREPVDALGKANAEVSAARAELDLAEARRKAARGNSVKKAERAVEAAKATLATALARVTELTPPAPTEPAPTEESTGNGKKRGASKRTGENAEKDGAGDAPKESTTFRSHGAFVTIGKDGLRIVTVAAMANDDSRNAARVAWVVKALNRLDASEPFPG